MVCTAKFTSRSLTSTSAPTRRPAKLPQLSGPPSLRTCRVRVPSIQKLTPLVSTGAVVIDLIARNASISSELAATGIVALLPLAVAETLPGALADPMRRRCRNPGTSTAPTSNPDRVVTKLRDSAVKPSATASISAWVLKVMTAVLDESGTLSNL